MEKLPIPVIVNGKKFTHAEIKRINTGELTEICKVMDNQGDYKGVQALISRGISSLSGDDGSLDGYNQILNVSKNIPYVTAEFLAIKIILHIKPENEKITGYWKCPVCGDGITYGMDSPLTISQLKTNYLEGDETGIKIKLDYPVVLINEETQKPFIDAHEITFQWPTLGNCIDAFRPGASRDATTINKFYGLAITEINGDEFSHIRRVQFGDLIIKKTDPNDLKKLTSKNSQYGIQKKIEMNCFQCGTEWDAPIELHGFFSSGLMGE